MRQTFFILALSVASALVIGLLVQSRFQRQYEETVSFSRSLEERFQHDERFVSLMVASSTGLRINIMGPVANSNLMGDLKAEVLALGPPVPTAARLYVGSSTSPSPEDFGKDVTWIISP